jgi:hypothetical protein
VCFPLLLPLARAAMPEILLGGASRDSEFDQTRDSEQFVGVDHRFPMIFQF